MIWQECNVHIDLGTVASVPALKTVCGLGVGLAACPALGLLVTSNSRDNTLTVFTLPRSPPPRHLLAIGDGLERVCTLGGPSSPPPMHFLFGECSGYSGYLAFTRLTDPGTPPLLVVTDAGHDAVHVIDVVRRVNVGYVAGPGTIAGPRGVAARGSLVAVSAWRKASSGDHVVVMFEGSGAAWSVVRVVAGGPGGPGHADGLLDCPYGLRFTGDGAGLAVADRGNGRVSLFRVSDGSFVRHVVMGLGFPRDVEECEGGWLVANCSPSTIESVCGGGPCAGRDRDRMGAPGSGDGEFSSPSALAVVPGLGLAVREWGNDGRLQFFATHDAVAMASMSPLRVAWLGAVAMGVAARGEKGLRKRQRV